MDQWLGMIEILQVMKTQPLNTVMQGAETIIYELPLNECIRVCLRLEHLFKQISQNIDGAQEWECRYTLNSMIDAINVVDRPDIKSKFTQALSQHAASLSQWEEKPHVHKEKLREILRKIDHLIENLYRSHDKMVYGLRNNNFLANIRQHSANPGGAAPFCTPAYYLWLQKSAAERNQQLKTWFSDFDKINEVITLLLEVARGSSYFQPLTATQGFYQQALDPKMSYHMVRVSVPIAKQVYPEMSVGRHRLSVRFLELNIQDKALQSTGDIDFILSCCAALVNI